jgi:hypothetical protein
MFIFKKKKISKIQKGQKIQYGRVFFSKIHDFLVADILHMFDFQHCPFVKNLFPVIK